MVRSTLGCDLGESSFTIHKIKAIKMQWIQSWRRQWHPTPVLLPGKSHGWRNLVGCSPWGHKEWDTTELLHFHVSLSCIGEGNGNPLQCSCLENPRDGGAWWAAVYGVAQSRTRLKWLSGSSSRVQSILWTRKRRLFWIYYVVAYIFLFNTAHVHYLLFPPSLNFLYP